jgi:hypothetical protein
MSMNEGEGRGSDRRSWARRYPPLALIAAALLIVLAVLPSALTLPNTNPSEVPEYAPVPPQKENPPPVQSNLAAVNLGKSSGITTEVKPPKLPGGIGGNPTIYNCVAGHQTEDPLSPPCSPFFTGDNGGATYQGVSKDEVRVIFYMDGSIGTTGQASYDNTSEVAPQQGTYCDADAAPNSQKKCANETGVDHMWLRITRAYERYLNARFQTYGRHIHFWVYYSGATDAGGRRADAADNFERIKPFTVIDWAVFRGFSNAYVDAMARNGVVLFSSQQINPRSFYEKYDPLVWSFWPDIEQRVDHYVDWICKKVAPYPVAHTGEGIARGGPRKYVLYYTTDPGRPDLDAFRRLAIPKLESRCIPKGSMELTFPFAGYIIDTGGDPAYARLNVARMRGANITTMLWLGGIDGKTEQAADDVKYYPEVFFAGDNYMESGTTGFYSARPFHAQVAVETSVLREGRLQESVAYQAWREAEPNAPDAPDASWISSGYRDFFMVGMGIQVAGPRLHPTTVAEGFRAIPAIASKDPFLPACYFTQGHFCVQDATEMWWDNTGEAPGTTGNTGCYRMPNLGRRYVLGEWATGDDVFKNPQDVCNAYDIGALAVFRTPGFGD